MTVVFDVKGVPETLAPRLARGGEGEVFPLCSRPELVVKCYHPEKLQKDGAGLREKIEAMRSLSPLFRGQGISWPAISVYDEQKQWIGYAMPRANGRTFHSLAHAVLYKKHAPWLTRRELTMMMLDWLKGVRNLHARNIMIGDYNLNNFMWDPDTLKVGFIDCDSYQLMHESRHYPCLVGSPDLTAPEHHKRSFKDVVRTPESECFSIAIILFKCYMLGRHPYDIVDGEDPVQNLLSGQFAYGEGNNGKRTIPKGNWYNIWSHMSHNMKSLFIRTFTEGVRDPSRRASVEEWVKILELYLREMDKGYHNAQIVPDAPKAPVRRQA